MKPIVALWIVAATILGTVALLAWTPFEAADHLLQRWFAAGSEWTQVRHLHIDPETQEVSHGENPMPNLARLGERWSAHADGERIVFIGNSQMFYMSLAPGEPATQENEKTYPDLVAETYQKVHGRKAVFRLAAPGMSYTEALWYANFLATSPGLRPTAIVLQLNYQTFWNAGIREGMLEMLEAPQFASEIQKIATAGEPYSDDFADALHRYAKRKEKAAAPEAADRAGMTGPVLANHLESAVRDGLEDLPLWRQRSRHRGSFYDVLYSARIYLLHIKPTTARSINGARLWRSQSALKATARVCRDRGIKLYLFNAPVNPKVSLYRKPDDLKNYRQFITKLIAEKQVSFYDLESAIPAPLWGTWMNGPDPLHLGRQGHRMMAASITRLLNTDEQKQ